MFGRCKVDVFTQNRFDHLNELENDSLDFVPDFQRYCVVVEGIVGVLYLDGMVQVTGDVPCVLKAKILSFSPVK